jgi:uncharacterized membrane protein YjdF
MFAMRALYLAGIIFFAARGDWGTALFHSIIFAASLFVPLLGRRDERFYRFDSLIMLVFILALVWSYFGLWPEAQSLLAAALGFDKIFHMAGGACLALFAALYLRTRVKDPVLFYAGIILFALALGGLWEIFEWAASILPAPLTVPSSGYADSMLDMVADTLGAAIAALVLGLRRYV